MDLGAGEDANRACYLAKQTPRTYVRTGSSRDVAGRRRNSSYSYMHTRIVACDRYLLYIRAPHPPPIAHPHAAGTTTPAELTYARSLVHFISYSCLHTQLLRFAEFSCCARSLLLLVASCTIADKILRIQTSCNLPKRRSWKVRVGQSSRSETLFFTYTSNPVIWAWF